MSKNRVPEGISPIVTIDGKNRYRPPMEVVRGLAWNIGGMVSRSSFEIKYLVGVTRGGLTPTDCVSRALGIKDIQTLAIEVYDEDERKPSGPEEVKPEIAVYRKPVLPRGGKHTLFVDDVLDTGTTAGFIKENWPQSATAVVFTKHEHESTLEKVDFYGQYVGGIWVDFPWEVEAQTREDIRNNGTGLVV